MKIGFPHAGNVYIPIRTALQELGVDFVVPPPTSKRTLDLATKYSPEGVCLPFKLTLGNLIESCELGADTLLQAQGFGVCRLGYYARSQEGILHDMGYNIEMVKFSVSEGNKLLGFMRVFKRISGNASWPKIITTLRFGLSKLNAVDELEKLTHKMRPREERRGETNQVFKEATSAIENAGGLSEVKRLRREYKERLQSILQRKDADPLKVGIVGEIFVVLEPFSNLDVERELGKLGVEVIRTLSYSRWVKYSLFLNPLGVDEWREVHKKALPYLKRDVGGDGWESVGEKVLHSRDWDGMVHLAPFTCLPEIVAQNIMSHTKEDLPVLTILCDEQMGKTGMITRLEAFVDLLKRRRTKLRSEGLLRN